MSKGITSTPIEMALNGVTWEAAPEREHPEDGIPYATHSGIWKFMGKEIRVYRLNNGKAIIDADDFWKILGVEDQTDAASERQEEK